MRTIDENSSIPDSMRRTIRAVSWSLGVEGFFGVFTAHWDLGIIAAAWTGMFASLANQAGHKLDRDTAYKLALGIAIGVGGFAVGYKIAATTIAYTGVGTLPAMVANAGTNGLVTHVVGNKVARVFLAADPSDSAEDLMNAILRLIGIPPEPTR